MCRSSLLCNYSEFKINGEMALEPETDREAMIELSGDIKELRAAIERFGTQLLNLETTKFNNHELRIEALEGKEQERVGMWKFIIGARVVFGVILTILTIKTFVK